MANTPGEGSWLVARELLERGDPAFVDEFRKLTDAEALGAFAVRWYDDPRPASRRLLLEYLTRPMNAYGHEPVIKRLFKKAEAARDDETLARFLVLFDRSVRREQRRRTTHRYQHAPTAAQAEALRAAWEAEGYQVTVWRWINGANVNGWITHEVVVTPHGTAMPRGKLRKGRSPRTSDPFRWTDLSEKLRAHKVLTRQDAITEEQRSKLERYTLFSVHTRNYLRRRAWRYFRTLGKEHPERYLAAVSEAIKLYEDRDAGDGLALIDNWGLMHILFHHSPVLTATASGWWPAEGRSLAELEPAPIYEEL